jgi:hypothetical protein
MSNHDHGQNGRKPGDDRHPPLARAWFEVSPEVLWRFLRELSAHHSLEGLGEMTGLSKETIRKFLERISEPNTATRRRLGELYLKRHPFGAVQEAPAHDGCGDGSHRTQLIDLLPRGEANALAAVAALFQTARRFPQHVSRSELERLQTWMEIQVRGEYEAERFYARFPRRERGRAAAARRVRRRPARERAEDERAD